MSEWKVRRISDVAHVFDGPHATPKKTSAGPWFMSISSLVDGRLDLRESAHLSEEEFVKWTKRVTPQAGDVLFSYETRLGAAALMPAGVRACLGRRMALLRPRPGVDPAFLLYAFLGPEFQETIRRNSVHGATVDRIPLNEFPNWPIRIPDPVTQRATGRLLRALDEKIGLNERIAETSLALADAKLRDETSRDPNVSTYSFDELARQGVLEFGDGYRTKRSEIGQPGIPVLRVAEVQDARMKPAFVDYVSEARRGAMGNKVSRAGDVVLTTKGTVGRALIVPDDAPQFVYSPQVCFFRVRESAPFSNHFLFFWFRGREFWQQARSMKGQTDMADYLSLSDIRSLRISVPSSLAEGRLLEILSTLIKRLEAAYRENRALAELRDVLLPNLVSGEMRLKDIGDVLVD